MKYKYELWYDFHNGTQKKVKTFIDKKNAWRDLRALNAKCEFYNPYFLKRVKW